MTSLTMEATSTLTLAPVVKATPRRTVRLSLAAQVLGGGVGVQTSEFELPDAEFTFGS